MAKLRILERKILLVDCFDSFTFNLKHYLDQFAQTVVIRIDKLDLDIISNFDALVLSPGPKLPEDYPKLFNILETYYSKMPILGVCLGMQAIGLFFGSKLVHLKDVKHGLSEPIFFTENDHNIYYNLENELMVARYHSWIINETNLFLDKMVITSRDENGEIMSIKHKTLPISAIQYHPESIMTPKGLHIIENWVNSI